MIYLNADTDAAKQQQQFNSAIAQGRRSIVLDPVDSAAAASLVHNAQSQGVKVIAYDRPIPDAQADFYVLVRQSGHRQGDRRVVRRPSEVEGRVGRRRRGRPPDQRLADRRSRGTDQEGKPRGTRHRPVQDACRIRHAELAADQRPSNGRPDRSRALAARSSVSWRRMTGTAGGAIAAFKAAGVNPVPPGDGQ